MGVRQRRVPWRSGESPAAVARSRNPADDHLLTIVTFLKVVGRWAEPQTFMHAWRLPCSNAPSSGYPRRVPFMRVSRMAPYSASGPGVFVEHRERAFVLTAAHVL